MKNFKTILVGLLAAAALSFAGCGGGGGGGGGGVNNDIDGDGIPNASDAAPNDASVFAAFSGFLLDFLAPASTFSVATDITNGDMAVGFSDDALANIKAVRWTFDEVAQTSLVTQLDPIPTNVYSAAYGANDGGMVVGESADGADFSAVIWDTGATTATTLQKGTLTTTAAYGANGLGQIVGEGADAGNLVAVLWNDQAAAPVLLGNLPGGTTSSAYSITDGGVVVGEADNGSEIHAVLWLVDNTGAVTGGPIDLGKLAAGDIASIAYSANDLGEVVGESEAANGEIHAVQWTVDLVAGTVTATADLGQAGSDSSAYANNGINRIAGADGRSGTALASVWDNRNTALPNAVLSGGGISQAFGLNEANLTVGVSGNQAFVAVPQ
ncbi:hypothetical protein DESUT3_29630 [Desulfuromonas versatilis]|uniref:DUF3466 family protein n=1 Tax=Desulfuromonas versatilis TaxID=2802975 RepID=A0ABM8HZ63_9BACT|nr:hypothetical protein [Desulfuromonas versatilis]BCR05894.1 hypothetical protein DESUT3_29630 [Desulfuromonas versatilis]